MKTETGPALALETENEFMTAPDESSEPEEAIELSPRESEIARLVAAGYPNKTIAGILDISPWTVSTHIRRIYLKLCVHGRAAMVANLAAQGFRFRPARVKAKHSNR